MGIYNRLTYVRHQNEFYAADLRSETMKQI